MRLAVVDDHPVVLTGLEQLLTSYPDLTVVLKGTTGAEAVAAVRVYEPDLLLLDLKLPDMSGLDVLRMLQPEHHATRIVLLTAAAGRNDVDQARALGAAGMLYKDVAPEALVHVVRQVGAGGESFPAEFLVPVRDAFSVLTPREREVVALVAGGVRNRQIAARFGITEGTVKLHLHNIYEKLGVDGRLDLLLSARRAGIGE